MSVDPAIGILAYGAYLPRLRLQRASIYACNSWFAPGLKGLARGERAIANWDEDSVTMAVEAARNCLGGLDRSQVRSLTLASTTLPFADRLNAGIVKEALNLADAVAASDATGSQRAGTSALLQCLGAAASGPHLCLAADLRKALPASEAELQQGDAAAALLVGTGAVIARVHGIHSMTVDFVDHYRAMGERFDYWWENRWIRDEGHIRLLGEGLRAALQKWAVAAQSIDALVLPAAVSAVGAQLARHAGIRAEALTDPLSATVGDSGAAHPLLLLAAALDQAQPGQKLLVAGFGQGCDLLLLETTEALLRHSRTQVTAALARGCADTNYLRFLAHRGLLRLDKGMRAEQDQKQPGTTLYRHRKAVLGLIGGRCTHTGVVQFPRSDIGVDDPERRVGTQEDYPLAERRARIVSYTADNLTYSPAPPSCYGMIDFEGGGRLLTEFVDIEADKLAVGREMRMVFRIKAVDTLRDFTKYFWKAAPLNPPTGAGS